jgi:hypothetical protein
MLSEAERGDVTLSTRLRRFLSPTSDIRKLDRWSKSLESCGGWEIGTSPVSSIEEARTRDKMSRRLVGVD